MSFDGSSSINHFVTCETSAATQVKEVTLYGFSLSDGAALTVHFTNANSASNPKLKVITGENTYTAEVPICLYGTNAVSTQEYASWRPGYIISLVYDATNVRWTWVNYQRYAYASTSATSASYTTYVGSNSTNRVATYNYVNATNRSLRPTVNYTLSAYVDLGESSYRWGTLYAHSLGGSDSTIDYASIDTVQCDYMYAANIGELGDPAGYAYIDNLYPTRIGDSNTYVTDAHITDAYITNIHGTVDNCTYAQYIGSNSTNSVATYSYTSATVRSFHPVVNYSTSAFVNLGNSSYRWGYVYANYIGSSSYKVATVYATNLGASSYYVTNTYSTNVYATNLGSASGSSISNAYIDYLSATTIGAINNRVTEGYFTNLSATNIGSSSSTVTEAYIDYMTGTASYAEEAGKAIQDSNGSAIYTTYITDIATSTSSSSITVYNTAAGGTTSSTVSVPTSNLLLKNNNNAATKYTRSIATAIAGAISNTNDVGMIRLVAFKTTASWTKKTTDIYISGSLLRPVDLRTEDNDTGCIIRINAETTLNNSTYSGTWRVLHRIGNINSGNMFVALAIRIA